VGLTLHDMPLSGNSYKVRLAFSHLALAYARVRYAGQLAGATRTEDFKARINANGKLPVLELEDGQMLPESNAILHYLAQGSPLWPQARLDQARVLQWMFFEQYSHEPNVAVLIYWRKSIGEANLTELQKAMLPGKEEGS
jgi:glutathione S-transferase